MAVRRALQSLVILTIFLILFDHIQNETDINHNRSVSGKLELFHVSLKLNLPAVLNRFKRSSLSSKVAVGEGSVAIKLTKLLKLINVALVTELIILSGDISSNPGPIDLSPRSSKGLSICHWNIRALTDEKFDEISQSLASKRNSENKLDILILTESFLSDVMPSSYYQIPGYETHRKDRQGRIGGGILVYVNDSLVAKRRRDLETNDTEILWLEVCPHKSHRPMLISGVYRPPSANKELTSKIGKNIGNACLKNLECIVTGDFNIDALNGSNFKKNELVKNLMDLNLTQCVDFVTRPVSKTCLDHFWLSHPSRIQRGAFSRDFGLSDHLPIFVIRQLKTTNDCGGQENNQHSTIEYRNLKNLNESAFAKDLSEAPWDAAFLFEETDDIMDSWYAIFNDILNNHAPIRLKRIRRQCQPQWFNNEIINDIQNRDYLFKKAKLSQRSSDWFAFRMAKNKVTMKIRQAKQSFFKSKITENKNNPKKLWSLLNDLAKSSSKNIKSINQINENGEIIRDKSQIVALFNDFFINKPISLLKSSMSTYNQSSLATFLDNMRPFHTLFDLPPITASAVQTYLLNIPLSKATGADGLSPRILQIAAASISPSVARLINHCISTHSFPSTWKLARVNPIYKGQGSRQEKDNFRPISILPILSKIFERHIYDALFNYVNENNLMHTLQSGFRKRYSTDTALIRLVDQILFDLDKNNVSGLIFVDYSKAFDLIDHQILLTKLKAYGICGSEIKLFENYLSGRSQYVTIDGFKSKPLNVSYGVPQGSVLGPLLFLLFVNDLHSSIQNSVVDAFADDTTFSSSSHYSNISLIQTDLQNDMENLQSWSDNNRMILNAGKTKSMLLTGKRLGQKIECQDLAVSVNHTELDQVTSHKLLGLVIDDNLSFHEHVDKLCGKLSQRIGLLRKIRRYLPKSERKVYYNAVIKPVMMYGSMIWSLCSKEDTLRVFKLQKRAARVILGVDMKARTVGNFNQLNWIPYYDEIKINKCGLVHKSLSGNAPSYIEELFLTNHSLHKRQTRHGSINLVCPKFQRSLDGGRTFTVSTIKLWNSLPADIRKISNINTFKLKLRSFFKDLYHDVDNYESIFQ